MVITTTVNLATIFLPLIVNSKVQELCKDFCNRYITCLKVSLRHSLVCSKRRIHNCPLRARCRVRTFSVPSAVVTRATTAAEVEEVTQVLLDTIHPLNISIRWSLI